MGQIGEELAGARQKLDVRRIPFEGCRMQMPQPFDSLRINMVSGLAQEHACEQAAAHADLAMDAPDREVYSLRRKRRPPSQHVLIDAVDQCAVEIEQKRRSCMCFEHSSATAVCRCH